MKRWLAGVVVLFMCAAAPVEKPQRTMALDAPVIEREPDPKAPGGEIWKASGGVTLTTPEATVSAPTMVLSRGKDGSLNQVHAFGGVTMKGSRKAQDGTEQRLNATCKEATYFISEGRLVLAGDVKGTVVEVERDRTWDLTSDRAHIWLREDRMKFERVKVIFTEPEPAPSPQQ